MGSCSENDYWDALVNKCMPCRLRCHGSTLKKCTSFCESVKCSKQTGFYYDRLLSSCVSCSEVCGQHPTQCASFCKASLDHVPEHRQSLSQDQTILIYSLLGLSLFITISSLLLILKCFLRSDAGWCSCEPPTPAGEETGSSKDRLVNGETTGGGGSGSAGSRTPEPIETCVFCYPEPRPVMEEGIRNHCIAHTPRSVPLLSQVPNGRYLRELPIDQDHAERPFTIICSPSQEKTSIT